MRRVQAARRRRRDLLSGQALELRGVSGRAHASGVRNRISRVGARSGVAAAPPGRAEKQTDRRVRGAQDVGVDLQLFSRGYVVVGGHGGGEENHRGEYRGVRRQLGQDAGALDADSGVSHYFDHGGGETLR